MIFLKNCDKHIFRFITIFVRENLINYNVNKIILVIENFLKTFKIFIKMLQNSHQIYFLLFKILTKLNMCINILLNFSLNLLKDV